MRFRYSFQQIVNLKSGEKRQAEWRLSKAVGDLQIEEHSLFQLQKQREHIEEQIHTAAINRINISQIQLSQSYKRHLDFQINKKLQDVDAAKIEVSSNKKKLSEKVVAEKVWLNAKENAFEQHIVESKKKEQEELDEIATVRYRFST